MHKAQVDFEMKSHLRQIRTGNTAANPLDLAQKKTLLLLAAHIVLLGDQCYVGGGRWSFGFHMDARIQGIPAEYRQCSFSYGW